MKEKVAIFKACHELTRNLVKNTTYDYHGTFSLALKLYNSNKNLFIANSKIYGVNIDTLAKINDMDFDIFSLFPLVDYDFKAKNKFDSLIKFSLYYGLKKRDGFRTLSETVNNTVSDNYSPISVDNLIKNDLEDLKQEIILYMLNRENDIDFQELPNVFKLLRAGDCVVTNYSRKETARAKKTFSITNLEDNGIQIEDKTDYFNTANIDGLILDISSKLPKAHRQLACDIIRLYCISGKGNISKKCRTQTEIAEILDISVRTVKSVWKEIIALNPTQFR